MRRIVDRSFIVNAPLSEVWDYLAQLERWPEWAPHIRRVERIPAGPLGAATRGTITLSNGMRSTFEMVTLEERRRWLWVGPFLGSRVYYDHVFEPHDADRTTVRFILDIRGWTSWLLGGLFGKIYRGNLERAIPLLIRALE